MRHSFVLFFFYLCFSAPQDLLPAPRVAPQAVQPVQERLAPQQIKAVRGFIGRRIEANRLGYLSPFNIDKYVRMVEHKKYRSWWWIGEQIGKWLESAVRAAAQARDRDLEKRARGVLARLIAAQEPSGYLGITDPALRTPRHPLRGMDAYELYFMLHGLLTAYDVWNDVGALQAARRLGDYFTSTIGPGKAEFKPLPPDLTIAGHKIHCGWEGTLLVDPMMRLYEYTGTERYLKWCRWVVSNIDRWSGHRAFSKLDDVAAGAIGIDQVQPYVHSHTFHMNFLGFLRLYRATGDKSLLHKVTGAWRDIVSRQRYITGGVSVGEHYERDHNLPFTGNVVETCAVMSWVELNQALLELTGETRYADAIELLLWNHIFAAQTPDGRAIRYHTPLNGVKPAGLFHGPDCCTGSGHRLISQIPGLLYGKGPRGVYVNQYVPSEALLTPPGASVRCRLSLSTDFPARGLVTIKVDPEKPVRFTLFLRIPAWCKAPQLELNGRMQAPGRPGRYQALDRLWRPGDVLHLTLPLRTHWVAGKYNAQGRWALKRGPVVYALDTLWWGPSARKALGCVPEDLGARVAVKVRSALSEANLKLLPSLPGVLGPVYQISVKFLDGSCASVPFIPFCNAGVWHRPGEEKPPQDSRAWSYAVYLSDVNSEEFRARRKNHRMLAEKGLRPVRGDWRLERGSILSQKSTLADCRIFFGDPSWSDYTVELMARKVSGEEGFLVIFRSPDSRNFYWWNVGGWGNRQHAVEREIKGRRTVLVRRKGGIQKGLWYQITVQVRGEEIRCLLNGRLIHVLRDPTFPKGRVGLGSWRTEVGYREVRVTDPAGKILYEF